MREAGNISQVRRSFKDSPLLYVPQVYWDQSGTNVLVMERIYGVNIADIGALKAANVDMKKLAEIGVEIFFSQVFRDRFFHADMHPGNIFVDINDPKNPKYIAVDFGIVGTLSEVDQRYIADNFLAFFNGDYARVASLHVESGWVPSDIRLDQFEMDIRAVCEPVFARPLKDIRFGLLLLNLFKTARKYRMIVQPQLLMLQKTLFSVEVLGRRLYPELDLWATAKPYLEEWVEKRMGFKSSFSRTKQQIPFMLEHFPELPRMIFNILDKSQSQNNIRVKSTKNKTFIPYLFFTFGLGLLLSWVVYS